MAHNEKAKRLPLIKSQLLYQLSYGVIAHSIATAKVLLFSELPTIFAIFFEKKFIFLLGHRSNISITTSITKT